MLDRLKCFALHDDEVCVPLAIVVVANEHRVRREAVDDLDEDGSTGLKYLLHDQVGETEPLDAAEIAGVSHPTILVPGYIRITLSA